MDCLCQGLYFHSDKIMRPRWNWRHRLNDSLKSPLKNSVSMVRGGAETGDRLFFSDIVPL